MVGIALLAADVLGAVITPASDSDEVAAQTPSASATSAASSTAVSSSKPQSVAASSESTERVAVRPPSTDAVVLRWLVVTASVFVLTAYAAASISRVGEWRNEKSLFLSALRVAPAGLKPLVNTAEAMVKAPAVRSLYSSRSLNASSPSGSTAGSGLHPWALAKASAEACIAVHGGVPACWTVLGTLALRERHWPRGHSVWRNPHAKRAAARAAAPDAAPDATATASATRQAGPRASSSTSWWADAAAAVVAAFYSRDGSDADLRDAEAMFAVASQLVPPPREMLNPKRLSGDARALQCFWAATHAARRGGLPLPCEAALGAAEVYLRIASGDVSGAPRVDPDQLSPESLALAKAASLPAWAIAVGGPAQAEFIHHASLSVKKGEVVTPAVLAWSLLEQAQSVECGVTAAAVADLADPMPQARIVASSGSLCSMSSMNGSGTAECVAPAAHAAGNAGDVAGASGRLISATHTSVAATELLLVRGRVLSLLNQPVEALVTLLLNAPSSAAPGSRLRMIYSCSADGSSNAGAGSSSDALCVPALTTRRPRVVGKRGSESEAQLPADFAAVVDALVPHQPTGGGSSSLSSRGGVLRAVALAGAESTAINGGAADRTCSAAAASLAPAQQLLRQTACAAGEVLRRLQSAASSAASAVSNTAAPEQLSRTDTNSRSLHDAAMPCAGTVAQRGIGEKELALCAAMADGAAPPAEELHALLAAASHTSCALMRSDSATAAAAERLVFVLTRCAEEAGRLVNGTGPCCENR